jgi:hypothetical protein
LALVTTDREEEASGKGMAKGGILLKSMGVRR